MSASHETPPAPTQEEILGALVTRAPDPPPGTFEFALVMGGTVSAGAYTAGAVDFLVEALDCFEQERAKSGPYHQVKLKVLCGTSGGAVTAAILSRALAYGFPARAQGVAPVAGDAVNPLYDCWVNKLDFAQMLDPSDISRTFLPSLLNAGVIDQAAEGIERYVGPAHAGRGWVGAPLTTIMTHTNLSGIPVNIDFGGGQYQRFIEHADHVRFAINYPWQLPATLAKPFEFGLDFSAGADWGNFGDFACASAAFPVGFITRQLERPLAHYQYRVLSIAEIATKPGDYWVVRPDWQAMLNSNAAPRMGDLRYSTVDGGVANNEPIKLAHDALAGLLGYNPRPAAKANRAVWLIDPFAGEADMGAWSITGLLDGGSSTLNSALQQCRYATADLALAIQPDIYSRYMLSAHRDGVAGGYALATAGLSAFMGFTCQKFREYDYYLGRRNCQDFLRNVFRLAQDNPVFSDWTAAQKKTFADADGELPIIPLFGSAAVPQNYADWPKGALDPEIFRPALEKRFRALLDAEIPGGFWAKLVGNIAGFLTEGAAASYVIGLLQQSLKDWKLV